LHRIRYPKRVLPDNYYCACRLVACPLWMGGCYR
jgi:hypothetical protein